uniref:Clathrin light chain n=1 Tax=Equus caballus TaxID=9796 RepID=A0A3Q2IID0_HORSE
MEQLLKAPQGQTETRRPLFLSPRRPRPEPAEPLLLHRAQSSQTIGPFPATAESKLISAGSDDMGTTINGDVFQEANGPADGYAAIAQADRLTQEPESIRKWREEQKKRLQELDAASKVMEQEWREKAKKDLEEWNQRQSEQVEKNKINNRASEEAFVKESKEETPGTEWEKVAQLCDFNPKSSKQCKDVSRLRSVLMSLKQTPLSR